MGESGLDALITIDPRNSFYVTGYMDPEVWLRDTQDMATLLPAISFPEDGTLQVGLSTPDSPGTYVLTLRGGEHANMSGVLYQKMFFVK